ncbi:hypothetical protein IMG5_073530 [Ichthyophthirius multifiliis]|uniref:Zinc finger protein n=1 Tax=Ichthyophthirius multifiliis TaxID=5932 RepID=G0QQ04_ICHMU|nr:hypothetical protein IMG5_073530 [Ichthyophthirius multifiliis]EGR32703.1 hypothetical protein IMG5_073530 [Ichthyophthirius multifiliis]|eukprot:XP_004036689.1 hypothetical protein IMG5_073530 [Ichthyophthirius multifiliis]
MEDIQCDDHGNFAGDNFVQYDLNIQNQNQNNYTDSEDFIGQSSKGHDISVDSYQLENYDYITDVEKAYTWNRDSHGLFDYESKGITKSQLKVPQPSIIVRDKEEIKLMYSNQIDNPDLKKLGWIDVRDNHYVVDSDLITYDPKLKPELEGLSENCVWKVKNIFLFNEEYEVMNMDDPQLFPLNDQTEENNSCRVCLGDTDEPDNPFITPCKCDGSVRLIHIKCLQQWLKRRLHPKCTSYSVSFVQKQFECELCKNPFPIELQKPPIPYITLEILSKDKNVCKGIHIITLSQKNIIKLGRGNDSDIKISDISVSRYHAVLSFENDIFTIEDNNSKFGTLILCKEPIVLDNNNNNIALQI